jgi:hypothetical protein
MNTDVLLRYSATPLLRYSATPPPTRTASTAEDDTGTARWIADPSSVFSPRRNFGPITATPADAASSKPK